MNAWFVVEVLLAFSFMIAIHEWGHFIVMRLSGVRVERFAIGFGPTLFAKKWGDTEYALLAIPLGGYCKPAGGDLSDTSTEKMYERAPEPGEFLYAAWWKRVLIALAGPAMNYLSAFLLMFVILMAGEQIPVESPVLGFVPPGSFAAQAGVKKNDVLLSIDGQDVKNLYTDEDTIYNDLSKNPSQAVTLALARGQKTLTVLVSGDLKKPGADLGLNSLTEPVIGTVPLGTPARKAGLLPGDRVLSINGRKVSDWNEVAYRIHTAPSDDVSLLVSRGGQSYPVTLTRIYNGLYKAIGIAPVDPTTFTIKRLGPAEAFTTSASRIGAMTALYLDSLGKLFTGKISLKDNLSGPVSIMRTMYQKAAQGWIEFLSMVCFISLVLGVMNLLPIPVLDGGQIVIFLVEGIKRGPVPVRWQTLYQNVGFVFIVALMALAVFNDVWGLILEKFHSQIP
ncbi:MAG TPA: RIP metalloprotease RseP [bacterium]|nr:RIP metalloprotease RseP [bacterium]